MNIIETTLAFYVFYMLTMAFFLGALAWVALGYSFSGHPGAVKGVTFAATGIPLAFLPVLLLIERGIPDHVRRLHLINIVMYFSYFAVLAVIVTLGVRVRKSTDKLDQLVCKTNVISSCSYVVLALAQWYFAYRGQIYAMNPFCIVNLVLFLMFTSTAFVIVRETLARKNEIPGTDIAKTSLFDESGERPLYPKCNQEESLIISLISQGATNQEISEVLGVSISRVKNVIYRIYVRFEVNSRTELISYFGKGSSLTQESDQPELTIAGTPQRAQPDS